MGERKRKRAVICLSSDDDDEDEDEDEDEEDEESDESLSDSSHSCYGSNCSEEEENEVSDDEDDARNVKDDDESLCNRVDRHLQEGRDLEGLNLKECKAYLRRYSLRLSGTKEVCITRIQEHWRIRDGNGEALYPRSSFVLNCTGDVCKGDVVLFIQRVHQQNGKMKRRGKFEGKRTVAGRVVKESYGEAKQQHTFTVEVLWSKGIQKLPSLYPLLVKGRNLYKLKTFRQRWSNEAERSKVLAEKHKRGAAARLVREKRKTKKARPADGGVNSRKHFHDIIPSQLRGTNEAKKRKRVRQGKAIHHRHGKPTSHLDTPSSRQVNHTQTSSPRTYESSRHQNQTTLYRDNALTRQLLADPSRNPYESQIRLHHHSAPYHVPNHHLDPSPATMRSSPQFRPHGNTQLEPPTQQNRMLDHDHSSYRNVGRPVHPFPLRNNRYGR